MPVNSDSVQASRTETSTTDAPETHTPKDNQLPNLMSMCLDWLDAHSELMWRISKLLVADIRLATTSGIQLVLLCLAFCIVFACTLLTLVGALAIFLMWLGATKGGAVLGVLFVLMTLLSALVLFIRSTCKGFTFTASKEALSGNINTLQTEE